MATGSVELMVVDLNHPVGFVHTVPGPGHKWTALVQRGTTAHQLMYDHDDV